MRSTIIACNGVSIGTVPASSQGVLTFRSSEGGLFTVRPQSAAPKAPANLRIPGEQGTTLSVSRFSATPATLHAGGADNLIGAIGRGVNLDTFGR